MTIRFSIHTVKSFCTTFNFCLLGVLMLPHTHVFGQEVFSNAVSDPIARARQAVSQNNKRVLTPMVQSAVDSPTASTGTVSSTEEDSEPAVEIDSTEETISVNVDDQEVRVVLRNIAELFELNIVIPDDLSGRTSLNLRDVTWPQIFTIVLEEKGYSWSEVNGIIRIRQGSNIAAEEGGDPRVKIMEDGSLKVEFRSTAVKTILSTVASNLDLNVVIPPDEALSSDMDLRLSNVTWEQVFTVSLQQFGYGYINANGIVMVRSLDQINGVPDVSRVFQVKYSEAESIANLLKDQTDVTKVVTDSRSNVIIVTGNPSKFPDIKALIDTLDRPTPQVMIESRFVEVSNKDISQIGVDWKSLFADDGYVIEGAYQSATERTRGKSSNSDDGTTNGFSSTNTVTDGNNLSGSAVESAINQVKSLLDSTVSNRSDTAIFSAPAFGLALRALKKLDDSKIVSNPTVLALNGQEAQIRIVDHYYVQKPGTVASDGRVTLGEVEVLDPLPGIELKVTPTISGGDFISLKVVPQVNDIVGTQVFTSGSIPIVRQRTTLTHVMVKDRETLAIGGLVDENTTTESTKIPLMGSIPGLGRLFRYDKTVTDAQNQIIFITASILNPNETNYIDVVGTERLNDLGLTDRDVMGSRFPISPEEKALNDAIMNYRRKSEQQEREDKLSMQLEAYRLMEEERAMKALKELEKASETEFSSEDKKTSASAMEKLRGSKGKTRPTPVF